jgi:penicillin-binding protein 1C
MKKGTRRLLIGAGALAAAPLLALGVLVLWPAADVPEFAAVQAHWTPSEAYLIDRHGELLDETRVNFGVRRFEWVPLDAISPAFVTAVVDGEDRRFWNHSGVDWAGAVSAIRDDVILGRTRGASTITMQLAGLIDAGVPARGSSEPWRRKWTQIRIAQGLEAHWSKRQILEAYFNLLGFRRELQGIGAASELLVDKAPSGLTLEESLVLAALLPAPNATADRVAARACARARARQVTSSCERIETAATAILRRASQPESSEHLAPQLANALLKTPGQRVTTTLDARLQRLAHDALSRRLADLDNRNVRDGAALVVDNESGDVLAYVGSAGPHSTAGSVDGVRAQRQAGSTLKPFLYEMAIERRYLTAASLLDDSALNLDTATGVYLPQDYDHDFKGLVSVRTALGSSLNVPAVRTLVLVGVDGFRDRLRQLGYAGLTQDGDFYGYALALGSAEVTLWEQAQAYRVLARGGRWSAIHVQPGAAPDERTLLPADSSFIVADILSDRAARALTFGLDNHLNTPFWSAAKTGTSKDMRDNWCVGFSQRYTVAVWVGNFEGDSMHDVSGVTGAAPVWQEIMTALHADRSSQAPAPPRGVVAATTEFSAAIEPARREWYLDKTQTHRVSAVAESSAIARIASPANGMVIAIDPDIPANRQRIPIAVQGASASMTLLLNGAEIGPANAQLLWAPTAGAYRLAVADSTGRVLDQILFTVR